MTATGLMIFYIANWMHAAYSVSRLLELGNSMWHLVSLSVSIAFIVVLTILLNATVKAKVNEICK
jgi:hypothetical protein